jgi:hypothetical protein
MLKRVSGATIAFGCALLVATVAVHAADWGTGFDSFRDTCAALDGDLSGQGAGATCSYGGDVVNVPALSPGWTVDVATGTVATWLGGSNVTEDTENGAVVACYNPAGRAMSLSHRHCVPE